VEPSQELFNGEQIPWSLKPGSCDPLWDPKESRSFLLPDMWCRWFRTLDETQALLQFFILPVRKHSHVLQVPGATSEKKALDSHRM